MGGIRELAGVCDSISATSGIRVLVGVCCSVTATVRVYIRFLISIDKSYGLGDIFPSYPSLTATVVKALLLAGLRGDYFG